MGCAGIAPIKGLGPCGHRQDWSLCLLRGGDRSDPPYYIAGLQGPEDGGQVPLLCWSAPSHSWQLQATNWKCDLLKGEFKKLQTVTNHTWLPFKHLALSGVAVLVLGRDRKCRPWEKEGTPRDAQRVV